MSSPQNMPNVAKAGGIMILSLFLSRVLGLIREMVMSGKFGSDQFTDAYRLAFQIPDLLFFLIAGGALSSAFIPVFSEYLHTKREEEAWHIFSVVTTIMSLIIIVLIVVAWVFAEPLAGVVAPGKDPGLYPLIAYMSRIILPAQFAFFIGGIMFGTLYARQMFTVPGLGPNIYNLGIITGALTLSAFVTPGVIGMSWGALLGAIVGNLVIPYFAMRKLGANFKPSLDWQHPGVKKVFRLMLPVVLGLSLPGVYALIMQWFGTFYQAGVNTWLNYANTLMQAPLGIFGQSLAIAVFPALTQFFAQERMDLYRKQLVSTLSTVIYLTLPTAVLILVLAPQITTVLYQHGKFTGQDSVEVARILQLFAIGIPAWCLHPVLMRAFFSIQKNVTPIVLGTITTGVFIALVLTLRTVMDFRALPLASSFSAIFLVIVMMIAIRKSVGEIDFQPFAATVGKTALASLPIVPIAYGVAYAGQLLMGNGKLATIVPFALAFFLSAFVYYTITKAMQMSETAYVTRAMDRLKKKSSR